MISIFNKPINSKPNDDDFTEDHYRSLLQLASKNYIMSTYRHIPWGTRFILWRHDCDVSLNRSLALARIEQEEGIKSTFFLNPNCYFYNLFERSQVEIVKNILKLGHDIGVHFDASLYCVENEIQLGKKLLWLANNLEWFFGAAPTAFSFHNPGAFHMSFEAETYAELINCYSRRFKTDVGYCSDSNGHWRFRRLYDVLTEGSDPCLQVLTHPACWQVEPMAHRRRVFRSAYGRAAATMKMYDSQLQDDGRENLNGSLQAMKFIQTAVPGSSELLDFLWNTKQYETLFAELWRLHEYQINQICRAAFLKDLGADENQVNVFFENDCFGIDSSQLFLTVFGHEWHSLTGHTETTHRRWEGIKSQLLGGRVPVVEKGIVDGCRYLCGVIEAMAKWGLTQPIKCDGFGFRCCARLSTSKAAKGKLNEQLGESAEGVRKIRKDHWNQFLGKIRNLKSNV